MENITNRNELEEIMYHSDGTFKPFVAHHGNVSVEVESYRNNYIVLK